MTSSTAGFAFHEIGYPIQISRTWSPMATFSKNLHWCNVIF